MERHRSSQIAKKSNDWYAGSGDTAVEFEQYGMLSLAIV